MSRPDGGDVVSISPARAESLADLFGNSIADDEKLIVALDPDGRPVGMLAVPEHLEGTNAVFLSALLQGVLDIATFGDIMGPIRPAESGP